MPATKELIAHKRTVRQIKRKIGADELIYQELEDLTLAAHIGNPKIKKFEAIVTRIEDKHRGQFPCPMADVANVKASWSLSLRGPPFQPAFWPLGIVFQIRKFLFDGARRIL